MAFRACQAKKTFVCTFMKKNSPYKEIGNRIKLLRGDGHTQKQFAALLGISLRSYQKYEYGERVPPLKTLSKISKACNVTTDWLIAGKNHIIPEEIERLGSELTRVAYAVGAHNLRICDRLINDIINMFEPQTRAIRSNCPEAIDFQKAKNLFHKSLTKLQKQLRDKKKKGFIT